MLTKTKQLLIAVLLCALFVCGCTKYYRVTDPSTNKDYYTKDVKTVSGGAVKITDERTGNTVTLQNSEVEKIEKQDYEQGIFGQVQD
ncbi:MAG: hypothetical protein ACYTET_05835 [Planctomycetota bacterium]|jgi:hypothetical protein